MNTPEAPRPSAPEQADTPRPVLYLFSPEFQQEVGSLTVAALTNAKSFGDTNEPGGFKAYIWRSHTLAGILCRIESPLLAPIGENPVNTLWYELHGAGRLPGTSSIQKGLRRPEPGNPRPYGLVDYTVDGVVAENEKNSTLVERYIRLIAKKDWEDPEQRAQGYEHLLRTILTAAQRGWENPVPLPDYNWHLR